MKSVAALAQIALLAGLAACSGPEEPAADATPAAESMKMEGPFAQSEMDMDKAMKDAVGIDAADTWIKKMIAHHDGAIAMSRVVLGLDPTADVARMAQMTIDNQGAEIEALRALARNGAADPASAKLYDAAVMEIHEGMMAASGATPSESYLAKMLAHHRGAVAMSDIALANGATGAIRRQIEETREEQQKEIDMTEAMLRGEPMTKTAAAANPPAAPKQPAESVAGKTVASSPAAAKPTPAATAAPKAQEPKTPASSECTAEHREMGHC